MELSSAPLPRLPLASVLPSALHSCLCLLFSPPTFAFLPPSPALPPWHHLLHLTPGFCTVNPFGGPFSCLPRSITGVGWRIGRELELAAVAHTGRGTLRLLSGALFYSERLCSWQSGLVRHREWPPKRQASLPFQSFSRFKVVRKRS